MGHQNDREDPRKPQSDNVVTSRLGREKEGGNGERGRGARGAGGALHWGGGATDWQGKRPDLERDSGHVAQNLVGTHPTVHLERVTLAYVNHTSAKLAERERLIAHLRGIRLNI